MADNENAPLLPSSSGRFQFQWKTCCKWMSYFLLAQLFSALRCSAGVSSVYLSENFNLRMPAFQTFLFYVVLSSIFTSCLAFRPGAGNFLSVLKENGWRYFLLALCDAEANYLVVKAYQYTTFVSVQWLSSFTIPTVVVVLYLHFYLLYESSFAELRSSVFVCLGGVFCLIIADLGRDPDVWEEALIGDALCLAGAFLSGVVVVAHGWLGTTTETTEYFGMIGFFGSFITGVQALVLERNQVTEAITSGSSLPIYLFICYALTQPLFYTLAAPLTSYSMEGYIVVLLLGNVYSTVIGLVVLHYQLNWMHYISFLELFGGVIVAESSRPSLPHQRTNQIPIPNEGRIRNNPLNAQLPETSAERVAHFRDREEYESSSRVEV